VVGVVGGSLLSFAAFSGFFVCCS